MSDPAAASIRHETLVRALAAVNIHIIGRAMAARAGGGERPTPIGCKLEGRGEILTLEFAFERESGTREEAAAVLGERRKRLSATDAATHEFPGGSRLKIVSLSPGETLIDRERVKPVESWYGAFFFTVSLAVLDCVFCAADEPEAE